MVNGKNFPLNADRLTHLRSVGQHGETMLLKKKRKARLVEPRLPCTRQSGAFPDYPTLESYRPRLLSSRSASSRSASTISATRPSKLTLGCHPSARRALLESPQRRSTSDGL